MLNTKSIFSSPSNYSLIKAMIKDPKGEVSYGAQEKVWQINGRKIKYDPTKKYSPCVKLFLQFIHSIKKLFSKKYRVKFGKAQVKIEKALAQFKNGNVEVQKPKREERFTVQKPKRNQPIEVQTYQKSELISLQQFIQDLSQHLNEEAGAFWEDFLKSLDGSIKHCIRYSSDSKGSKVAYRYELVLKNQIRKWIDNPVFTGGLIVNLKKQVVIEIAHKNQLDFIAGFTLFFKAPKGIKEFTDFQEVPITRCTLLENGNFCLRAMITTSVAKNKSIRHFYEEERSYKELMDEFVKKGELIQEGASDRKFIRSKIKG